jgi:hypothetical protein
MSNGVQMSVTIKPNASSLSRAFTNMNISSFLVGEVNRLAASVVRYSKQLTPVATGFLRASINFTPATHWLSTEVSTHTNYAVFVHEGTKFMRGRPFMKYGAMFAQVGVQTTISDRLDKEFTDAFKNL